FAMAEDPGIGRHSWVLVRAPASTSLEDEHRHPFFGQPPRRNRAAEATANDDGIEVPAHGIGPGSADALFVRPNRGSGVVLVVAPARVVKVDDMIGVVRGDGLCES